MLLTVVSLRSKRWVAGARLRRVSPGVTGPEPSHESCRESEAVGKGRRISDEFVLHSPGMLGAVSFLNGYESFETFTAQVHECMSCKSNARAFSPKRESGPE